MIVRKNDVQSFDFGGLEIFDYTAGCEEQSSFAVIHVEPKVRHQLSWSKRSDKYYYVVRGRVEFLIQDTKVTLEEGDFCIVRQGEKFYYHNTSDERVTLVLVHTPHFILEEEVYLDD
ncbi:MAG: cupin domain-containing protein [Spirochaetales bacterium]|nr:cupin domain-containing protein [Spirochaetales bacterium]